VRRTSSTFPERAYAALLRLLPFDFRSEYGSDMEETFRAQREEAERSHGLRALLKMWGATIADIVRMAPREHTAVLAQDARYALRMMRKNAGYTAAAILILGLGIGANTAIFSMVNAVLLQPLPYVSGDRLVVLHQRAEKAGLNNIPFSVHEISDYRQSAHSLDGMVEYHSMTFTLYGGAEAHRVKTGVVSHDFFRFFGIKPILGRDFLPEEEGPAAPPVLLLSYEFWKTAERGNPNVVGKRYEMNDRPHIVIGVLPPIPQYPNEMDVYMTTSSCPFRSSQRFIATRELRMMSVFARLRPDVSLSRANSDLTVIANRLEAEYPKAYPARMGYTAAATSLRNDLTKQARPVMLVLLGAAAFVLLIACANVANLILARMARREQELVIRTAVGAGAGRLLRQLLTESLIMALAAAAIGVAFAAGSMRLMGEFAQQLTPRAREIGVDGWMLAFAIVAATVTTVFFGSISALYARRDVAHGLKDGGRASAERRRAFLRSGLIAVQVAFSYALLIGAGLMVRSFIQLDHVDAGFVPQRTFGIGFDYNWSKHRLPEDRRALNRRILQTLSMQPGILSVAMSSGFPLDPDSIENGPSRTGFVIEGETKTQTEITATASPWAVSPDYFHALGIPLVAGRTFRETDDEKAENVAVISRSLARHRWGNQDPVGRRIKLDRDDDWTRVVGVVGDVKEISLADPAPDQVYMPIKQRPTSGYLVVRSAGDPGETANGVRRALHEMDPQIAINFVKTLEEARSDAEASPRTTARLFSLFAGLALLIALAGIASMLALWVRQRTRELGIRMALGASPGEIVGSILRQGLTRVAVGVVCGVAGALILTRALKGLLFDVTPTDLETYVVVSALLLIAALAACWAPARRAAQIDPQQALRAE
jgi:putative ABC transport system permease protein